MMLTDNLIQVAGIIDRQEAEMLQSCGVKYLGFPLRLPVNKEDLSEEEASHIVGSLKSPYHGVLITYLNRSKEIVEFCQWIGARIVQIHGEIEKGQLQEIKRSDPELTVIKSLVIGLHENTKLESMVAEMSPYVDAYITDTFDPTTGASGATGKVHDWAVSRWLVDVSERPVILAGGLTPDNVKRAIIEVRPAGVDVHTGAEDKAGRKSRDKVERFVAEAEAGFNIVADEVARLD